MAALVVRCDTGPPAVPSRVIRCDLCGNDCWLSSYSGDQTLALARADGDGRVCCTSCLPTLIREGVRLQD